jgi:putative transposase
MAERAGQGGLSVERMCELSGVSRARFYRHWELSAPRQADTALRDAIQQVIVEKRFYGYRRVQQELRQRGQCVNAKRVLRLMREDNLLSGGLCLQLLIRSMDGECGRTWHVGW